MVGTTMIHSYGNCGVSTKTECLHCTCQDFKVDVLKDEATPAQVIRSVWNKGTCCKVMKNDCIIHVAAITVNSGRVPAKSVVEEACRQPIAGTNVKDRPDSKCVVKIRPHVTIEVALLSIASDTLTIWNQTIVGFPACGELEQGPGRHAGQAAGAGLSTPVCNRCGLCLAHSFIRFPRKGNDRHGTHHKAYDRKDLHHHALSDQKLGTVTESFGT